MRIAFLVALVLALPAVAQDEYRYAFYTTFFNSSGTQVGYLWSDCYSQGWGGTSSSYSAAEFYGPCDISPYPVSCDSLGLLTVGDCPNWCVSPDYEDAYYNGTLPDCDGQYYGGGGGGLASAPARCRRRPPPVLMAGLQKTMWQPLAVLRSSR